MNLDGREWITNFLHSFPHLTFSFELTNSTFNPEDSHYRESIIFLAIYPLVLFVLFLLISLCCTCYQCKKQRPQKRVKSCCPAGIIGIVIFVTVAAAGVGLYGNEKTNNGVENFDMAVRDINSTLNEALGTISTMDVIVTNLTDESITELQHVLNISILNMTARTKIEQYAKTMLDKSNQAKSDIKKIMSVTPNVSLDFIINKTIDVEFIRWTTTVVVLSVILFCLAVSLCGCFKRSRCLLSSAICFGFFGLLFTWITFGIYLGGSVTNADLCMDPESFIEDIVKNRVEKDMIKVYVECKEGIAMKYTKNINDALTAVTLANTTLSMISNDSHKLGIFDKVKGPILKVRTQLTYGFDNLTALDGVFECRRTHENYLLIKDAICNTVLFNMFILLSTFVLMSLMLPLLQCLLPKMWHSSYKRKGTGYRPVDDTDPFVPRPPPYQDYGSLYGTGSLMGPSHNDPINLIGGPPLDSPPPAYSVHGFKYTHHRSMSETSSEA